MAISALGLCAISAAAVACADSPRTLSALALTAAALLALGLYHLRGLRAPAPIALAEPPPTAAQRDADLVQHRALEAALAHAPVALWRVDALEALPLNVAARRLMAPGGAPGGVAAAALRERVARTPTEGRHREVLSFEGERGSERALMASAPLQLGNETTRLVALMPIESELETEALVAWQQLVRVLTHEIMNSLTPIASLSGSAIELLAEAAQAQPDLAEALEAIARRSAQLLAFVESYRSVSQWPAPQWQVVEVAQLLSGVQHLVAADWSAAGGTVRCEVTPDSLQLRTDPAQLEQALLNLARNALEACLQRTDHHDPGAAPALLLQARLGRGGRLAITVSDNGPGVAPGLETQVFTPFFSTKAQGRGIGLAVVRQLVHGLGGTVRHAKRPSGGACFVLGF